MTSECKTVQQLREEFYRIDGMLKEKYGDHCCDYETCCEGNGCGFQCCNSEGNETFGICNCQQKPKIRSAADYGLLRKSEHAIVEHQLKCKICNLGASSSSAYDNNPTSDTRMPEVDKESGESQD